SCPRKATRWARCRSIAVPGTRWTGCSTGRPVRGATRTDGDARYLAGEDRRRAPFRDRPLVDRQVHHRRERAEGDGARPREVVGAGRVEDAAAEPGAEEAADLVAEEDDPCEQPEVAHPVDLPHQRVGWRHG